MLIPQLGDNVLNVAEVLKKIIFHITTPICINVRKMILKVTRSFHTESIASLNYISIRRSEGKKKGGDEMEKLPVYARVEQSLSP